MLKNDAKQKRATFVLFPHHFNTVPQIPWPKINESHILHHVFPYLTAYLKINYETGHTERRTGKTQRCIQV